PPNVIFILATTEEHKVPPTIISRCQRLMFKLINHDELAVYLRHVATLENINIDDPAIDLIARRSGGGLRDALGLLDQASLLATTEKQVQLDDLLLLLGSVKEDVLLEFSKAIKEGAAEPVLQAAGSLLGEGREPALIALELSKHFLNLAKAQLKIPVLGSPSYLQALSAQSQLFDKTELAQMIERLSALEQGCRRSTQSALTLEIGLLALCHRLEITELKQLKEKVNDLESRMASGAPLQAMPTQRAATRPPVAQQPHAQAPAAAHASAPAQIAPVTATAPAPSNAAAAANAHTAAQTTAPKEKEHSAGTSTTAVVTAEPDSKNESSEASLPQENVIADTVITYEESEEAEPIAAVAHTEIDEVWSALLDQLQERHTPTYSLLQSMCTPLTLTRDELVIGVKEMLQKSLESKIEHIRSAAQAATGRDLLVKIKPMTGTSEPKAKPKAQASGISPGKPAARETAAERPDVSAHSAMSSNESQKLQNKHTALSPAKPTKAPPGEPGEKGTLVKEAYRLFEGPGSREFADNS
ncbi:MAG: hypothetical protein IT342_06055, partial [Candidatus Melainabacteria bacterium]|nr:hypothetical protein [Candidatus Melainabacteria bacterium]